MVLSEYQLEGGYAMTIEIVQEFQDQAWTMLLYGESGIGKTTFAAKAPKALIINIENGLKGVDLKSYDAFATTPIDSWPEVKKLLMKCLNSERFTTIVIDSVSKLQELMIQDICKNGDDKGPKDTLAAFGYGAGYQKLSAEAALFLELVESLKKHNKNVILIAHATVETFQDPSSGGYDRFNVSLDKRISERIKANVDYIWYLHQEKVVAERDGAKPVAKFRNNILAQTSSSGAVVAKTRGTHEKFIPIKNDESARAIFDSL